MIVWITGLANSGKTTLCNAIRDLIGKQSTDLAVLDGDVVRNFFGNNLGYREEDRVIQIGRIQKLAKEYSDLHPVVIVGALYASADLLAWNRENFLSYYEIYLDAPIDLLRRRDTKDLYDKALMGELPHVVGIDIPWHAPENPDMTIDMRQGALPDVLAKRVVQAVPELARLCAKF